MSCAGAPRTGSPLARRGASFSLRGRREREWRANAGDGAGFTKANSGLDGIVWNILGQTYVPKQLNEVSFAWHATLPPTTFVPPHIHPTQDEFIYMLEGRMDA